MNYRDFLESISPPWLLNYWGIRFAGTTTSLIADIIADGGSQAIKAHLLKQASSPSDALPLIGNDRVMPRYQADSDDTYRDRLTQAWDIYDVAGNEEAITINLEAYGLTNVLYGTVLGGYSFESPSDLSQWSRFALIVDQPHPWTEWTYGGGGSYGAGWLYGIAATAGELDSLARICDKWKSGHEVVRQIVVIFSGSVYGYPGATYGAGGTYGGASFVYSV